MSSPTARGRGAVPGAASAKRRPTVTVYTRRSCKLCEMAERVVADIADGRADVVLVDIDTDAAVYERYTVRVPVVAVDGEEIAEYHVEPDDLRVALEARG